MVIRKTYIFIAVFLVIGITFFLFSSSGKKKLSTSGDRSTMVESINTFTFDFFRTLATQTTEEKNLFCTPLGVSTVLTMGYAGARGITAQEIEKTLHMELLKERVHPAYHDILQFLTDTKDYTLYMGNRVWIQSGNEFRRSFVDINRRYYDSTPEVLDFSGSNAGNIVGDWIHQVTHGQTKDGTVAGINQLTNLLLTSVIYFKGIWVYQFDPKATQPLDFFPLSGETIQVQMMSQQKTKFKYADWGDYKILEMPYKGETMSMLILLPARYVKYKEFERTLT